MIKTYEDGHSARSSTTHPSGIVSELVADCTDHQEASQILFCISGQVGRDSEFNTHTLSGKFRGGFGGEP